MKTALSHLSNHNIYRKFDWYLIQSNDQLLTNRKSHKVVRDRILFENISLGIGEGDRIGLIAKNGAGKTTLLNILAGKENYDRETLYSGIIYG